MVSLVDLENSNIVYSGQVFWDMVRPGVGLAVMGPNGCLTSVIHKVVETGTDQYFVQTRFSRYLLTSNREASIRELCDLPSVVSA